MACTLLAGTTMVSMTLGHDSHKIKALYFPKSPPDTLCHMEAHLPASPCMVCKRLPRVTREPLQVLMAAIPTGRPAACHTMTEAPQGVKASCRTILFALHATMPAAQTAHHH